MLLLLRLLAFQHSQLWAEGVLVRILVLGGLDPRTGLRALEHDFHLLASSFRLGFVVQVLKSICFSGLAVGLELLF